MHSTRQVVSDQPRPANDVISSPATIVEISPPVLICLLGNFGLLKMGHPVKIFNGGKAEALLCALALQAGYCLSREVLLCILWPKTEPTLATQSLNSLVYSLHRLLGGAIGGVAPVLHRDGYYQLNVEAGIGVDVMNFDALADAGEHQVYLGNPDAASTAYRTALQVYRGDLCAGADLHAVLERERLRARYLTLLMHLADYHFSQGDYTTCLDYARRLLDKDPCREDAHRLIMRCYIRRGERAQALRQYHLCQDILRVEFDAVPERATAVLYDQVRLDPGSI